MTIEKKWSLTPKILNTWEKILRHSNDEKKITMISGIIESKRNLFYSDCEEKNLLIRFLKSYEIYILDSWALNEVLCHDKEYLPDDIYFPIF